MYAGKIVEHGRCATCSIAPRHPYTKALLGSIPKLGSKEPLYAIPGQPPNLARAAVGLRFHPRCPRCDAAVPDGGAGRDSFGDDWTARCWPPAATGTGGTMTAPRA